jgi:hypothetical protein
MVLTSPIEVGKREQGIAVLAAAAGSLDPV